MHDVSGRCWCCCGCQAHALRGCGEPSWLSALVRTVEFLFPDNTACRFYRCCMRGCCRRVCLYSSTFFVFGDSLR